MEGELLGAALAIAASFSWSIAAILYRLGVEGIGDPLAANWSRTPVTLAVMLLIAFALGKQSSIVEAAMNPLGLMYIAAATILAIVGGDTLYMAALRDAGVSVTYPLAYAYVIVASIVGVIALGEKVTIGLALGVALVMLGAIVMGRASGGEGRAVLRGALEALAACVLWGTAIAFFKLAACAVDPIAVDAFKVLLILILLAPFAKRMKNVSAKTFVAQSLGGIFGIGVGDWLFYMSLPLIGAARATVITTASLAFSLLLASLLLREKVTASKVAATALIWTGVVAAILF